MDKRDCDEGDVVLCAGKKKGYLSSPLSLVIE